jgi:hypothetical protein
LCFFEPAWLFYLKFNLSKTIYFLKRVESGDKHHNSNPNFLIFDNFMPESYFEILDSKIPLFYVNLKPLIIKLKNIMTVTKKSDLLKLCKMIKVINEGVCAPG